MAIQDNRYASVQLDFLGGADAIACKDPLYIEKLHQTEEGCFHDEILPLIPIELVSRLYSDKNNVRPARFAIAHVAGLIYMKRVGISEDAFLRLLPFSDGLKFAVGIDCWNDSTAFGQDTFKDLKARIRKYDDEYPGEDIWKEITQTINIGMALKANLFHGYNDTYEYGARIDTLMINSYCAHRTRLEIIYLSNAMVIRELCRKQIPIPEVLNHYIEEGDFRSVVYYRGTYAEYENELKVVESENASNSVDDNSNLIINTSVENSKDNDEPAEKNSEETGKESEEKISKKKRKDFIANHRMTVALKETELLRDYCQKMGTIDLPQYDIFERMISDQAMTDQDGHLIPKNNKDILPDSMQSPYETDVTSVYKAGKWHHGYKGLAVEVFNQDGDGIVVEYQLEKNNYGDPSFMKDFQENHHPAFNLEPGKRAFVTADAGFVSKELNKQSAELGWDTYCAGVHGVAPDTIFSEFVLSDDKKSVLTCPEGHTPSSCSVNNGLITARFANKCCASCPNRERCGAVISGKKPNTGSSSVKVSESKIAAALCVSMREGQEGEEALELIHKRNAIEGTNSVYRRRYHIDTRGCGGIEYARFVYYTVVTCANIGKYFSYLKKKRGQSTCQETAA